MKKQKIKKFFKLHIWLFLFLSFLFGGILGAYTSYLITPQVSTDTGSNNSLISFTGTVNREGYYINNENNSSVIGNYFEGYYYDSLFGFFKLDWSTDQSENVRIVDSTDACTTGYGYKLGGKAYSDMSGYMDFNYDSTTFVYYCLDDGRLHGTAYGKYTGYQNFEGIQIQVLNDVTELTQTLSSDVFVNDTTNINQTSTGTTNVGGNINQLEDTYESIFYIIK